MSVCKFLLLLVLVFVSGAAFCRPVFPSIIGDNMVLQQQSNVSLWGYAKKGSVVTITTSWNKKIYKTALVKDSAWKISVITPVAGGPYTISFNDGETVTLKNILIGEVWVCSGQSNMEMPVKGFRNQPILQSNDILMDAENANIRLFLLQKSTSRKALDDCKGAWQESTAASAKQFSAVAFQFAKMLQDKLKVPVGVIGTYWGGTPIQAWMNANSLTNFPEFKLPLLTDTSRLTPGIPTVLYNGMIHPIINFGIKGFLWYQGESNLAHERIYDKLMNSMVSEWRSLWKQPDLSFYYVQIAPFSYGYDTGRSSALLRDAQLRALKLIPNSGMAVSMDVGARTNIHPPDKTTISKRLLYLALAKTYGKNGINFSGPVYKSMTVDSGRVNISFDFAENGLTSFGKDLENFEVAGSDKVFYPATARITTGGVVIQSNKVATPVAVRYAFKNWVTGDLFSNEGMPASSFRTDEW